MKNKFTILDQKNNKFKNFRRGANIDAIPLTTSLDNPVRQKFVLCSLCDAVTATTTLLQGCCTGC